MVCESQFTEIQDDGQQVGEKIEAEGSVGYV
jgi:hypothetical protein